MAGTKVKRGFVLVMWTGIFEDERGMPRFFRTQRAAERALAAYPSWGRHAVQIRRCDVRGNDYVIGACVAWGAS